MRLLGPHVQQAPNLTSDGWDWCRVANIVKAIDYPAPLTVARSDAVTIFRAFLPNSEQETISPRAFFDLTLHRLDGFRPSYIEGLNEHRAELKYGLESYIDWTTEYCRIAHAAGYKVLGFSFPTGCPNWDAWPVLAAAKFGDADAIGGHQYWAKAGFSVWNALRHRKVHELLGGQHPPFIISECGRDAVAGEGGEGLPGWHVQDVSAEGYVQELQEYDALLQADPYVLGATPFTLAPNEDRWRQFEMDSIAGRLADLTETAPIAVPAGEVMDEATQTALIEMEARQNALLTKALIALREGRFTGADGMDGLIVALNGGQLPDNYSPIFPK